MGMVWEYYRARGAKNTRANRKVRTVVMMRFIGRNLAKMQPVRNNGLCSPCRRGAGAPWRPRVDLANRCGPAAEVILQVSVVGNRAPSSFPEYAERMAATFQIFNADEIFQIAIDLEKDSEEFYREAADRTGDDEAREMYVELASWETGHVNLFVGLREGLSAQARARTPVDEDGEVAAFLKVIADSIVFRQGRSMRDVLRACKGPVDVLCYAVGLERRAISLYEKTKLLVPEFLGGDSIDRILDEEREHERMLRAKVVGLTGVDPWAEGGSQIVC